MSKSQCPFPNQFDLLFNSQRWTNTGIVVTQFEATAVKYNGWYTVYDTSDMNLPLWRRRCYGSGMRWYDLERKIQQGVYSLLEEDDPDIQVDISNLI